MDGRSCSLKVFLKVGQIQQSTAPKDAKRVRNNGSKKETQKMGLANFLTLAEANSTTKQTFRAIETDSESSKAALLIPVVRWLVSTKLVA